MDGELLGGLLLQFPWSFKNDPENRDYLSKLLDRFVGYPLVVEIRHASWNDRAFFDFLTEKSIAFCNIDQPQIGRSIAPSNRTTGPIGYVRLHGRNYQDWFREDAGRDARYDYLYSEEELDPWMEKISEVSENASETYVITNNHFRGQAVVNALQIRARIGETESPRTGVARRALPSIAQPWRSQTTPSKELCSKVVRLQHRRCGDVQNVLDDRGGRRERSSFAAAHGDRPHDVGLEDRAFLARSEIIERVFGRQERGLGLQSDRPVSVALPRRDEADTAAA